MNTHKHTHWKPGLLAPQFSNIRIKIYSGHCDIINHKGKIKENEGNGAA